jgi:hypothetical protein
MSQAQLEALEGWERTRLDKWIKPHRFLMQDTPLREAETHWLKLQLKVAAAYRAVYGDPNERRQA